jgi:hypothetical protein
MKTPTAIDHRALFSRHVLVIFFGISLRITQ